MKTNMYVWVALLATILFASCSKETSEPAPLSGGNAVVALEVKGTPMVNGRATGTPPSQADENTVKRIVVAIFNSGGATNTIAEFSSISGIQFNCTAGTGCTGLVVANAPAGHFAGVANKTDFLAKTISLDATLNGAPTATEQESKCLPMSGEIKDGSSASTLNLVNTGTNALNVSLSRLVARVSVNSIATDFTNSGMYPNATFELERVFLRDALETASPGVGAYATTKPATISWLHDAASLNTNMSNLNKPWLTNTESTAVAIPSTPVTTAYWFYAFANEETTNRTALVLEGKFDADGSGAASSPVTVYYPVIVNKNQAGTSITDGGGAGTPVTGQTGTLARNSKYNIGVTIKNIGALTPGATIDPADLTLTVTVDDWVLDIQQDVEFN